MDAGDISDWLEEVKERISDVDWRDPKVLAGIGAVLLVLIAGTYLIFSGTGTPSAKVQIKLAGKPVSGAYVVASLQGGKVEEFGPSDSQGYVTLPGNATILRIKLPDGKVINRTGVAIPGTVSTLNLERPFSKTVTFYVVGLDGAKATLYVYVDGQEKAEVDVSQGIATVNFGKDIVITPQNRIGFKIVAKGFQPWELNTTGADLQSVYNVTMVQSAPSQAPTGKLKVIVTKEGKPFKGRADLYDQTGTVVASAPITGGGVEFRGIPYGTYVLKIADENGTYVAKKTITVGAPDVSEDIKILTVQDAVKRGLVKEVKTADGKTIYVPIAGREENTVISGGREGNIGTVELNAGTQEYNAETGDGITISNGGETYAIVSSKPTVPIAIYVMSSNGRPVKGAIATVNLGYTKAVLGSDSSGKIEFGLHEGQCARVTISAAGYEKKNLKVCSADRETTVTLKKAYVTGDLQINVLDYDGNPVNNAKVVVEQNGSPVGMPAYTDVSGTAYLHGIVAGSYVVKVEKDGMVGETNASVVPDNMTNVKIVLYPGTATLHISASMNGMPVRAVITFYRADTGEKVDQVKTDPQGNATAVVPAILPIYYVLSAENTEFRGPIIHLAPGATKNMKVNVPSFHIPGIKIIGIYDSRGAEIADLPRGEQFKIVAVVGSNVGGKISASTDDPDDVQVSVEGNAVAVSKGYTTVEVQGYVSQYPLKNHAKITISAGDASKSVVLPIGNLMECRGNFCYSLQLVKNGIPISNDFKITAGEKITAKATILYRGKESAHVTAELVLLKNGKGEPIVGSKKSEWKPGDVASGEYSFVAEEGPYKVVLRLISPVAVKDTMVYQFVAAKKTPLKIVASPSALIRTDGAQRISIGVEKPGSNTYFAPDGLTYTIYGVRKDGTLLQIKQVQNASSPQTIVLSGIGKYAELQIHADAGTYASSPDLEIPIRQSPITITPNVINLSSASRWEAVHISTNMPDYPLKISVSTSKNSGCNIEFHATPASATLAPEYGKRTADVNVWYTGGDNCAGAVGGNVKITVMNTAGSTVFETSIPVHASPRGSCIVLSAPDEVSSTMDGNYEVIVKNRCTEPITVTLSATGEGYGDTTVSEVGFWDNVTLSAEPTVTIGLDAGEGMALEVHYKMGGGVSAVHSAKIRVTARRGSVETVEKDTVVYNTDLSNCLKISLGSEGKLSFAYDEQMEYYDAKIPMTISVGQYCKILPGTLKIALSGDLSKHATVDDYSVETMKIDLQNRLEERDPSKPISITGTITIVASDPTPLMESMTGTLTVSATAEPLAGPAARKTKNISASVGVYTVRAKPHVEIDGKYHFSVEGNEFNVVSEAPLRIYAGEKALKSGAFEESADSISVEKIYVKKGYNKDSLKAKVTVTQTGAGYWKITIEPKYYKDFITELYESDDRNIYLEGNATLPDGKTVEFTGALSPVPALKGSWKPKITEDQKDSSEKVKCYTVTPPAYTNSVKISVTVGYVGKSSTDAPGKQNARAQSITLNGNGQFCVWEVLPAKGSCDKSQKEVTVNAIPVVDSEDVDSLAKQKTVTVTPYYEAGASMPADLKLNPFNPKTWASPSAQILLSGSTACAIIKNGMNKKFYPVEAVAAVVEKMKKDPELLKGDINFLVYDSGCGEDSATCKSIEGNMNGNAFAVCEWNGTAQQIDKCWEYNAVAKKYQSAWTALEAMAEKNPKSVGNIASKIVLSSTSTSETIPINSKDVNYGYVPIIAVQKYSNKVYYWPVWYAAFLKVPQNVTCQLRQGKNGILRKSKNTYFVAVPESGELNDVVECYITDSTGTQYDLNVPTEPLAEISAESIDDGEYNVNTGMDANVLELNVEKMVPRYELQPKVCFYVPAERTSCDQNVYIIVDPDSANKGVYVYVGMKPKNCSPIPIDDYTIGLFEALAKQAVGENDVKYTTLEYKNSTKLSINKTTPYNLLLLSRIVDSDGCYDRDTETCGLKEAIEINYGNGDLQTVAKTRGTDITCHQWVAAVATNVSEITATGGDWNCDWNVAAVVPTAIYGSSECVTGQTQTDTAYSFPGTGWP